MSVRKVSEDDPRATAELFEVALDGVLDEPGPGLTALLALQNRPTLEVLETAAELCSAFDQDERLLGVVVLAELQDTSHRGGYQPALVEESLTPLLELAERETDDEVIAQVARAFGFRQDPRALPILLGWAEHAAQPVRFFVTCSLRSCSTPESEAVVADALIELSRDESGAVRDYALFAFDELRLDSEPVRQAALDRTRDPDRSAAGQALVNLAALADDRAIQPLIEFLNAGHGEPYGFRAATHFSDPRLLPALHATPPEIDTTARTEAIAACTPSQPTR